VTQNSVDETLMDENIFTSFNRWKPEKAPKTLDENSITSINQPLEAGKAPNFG